jgi:hypothetical protein
VNGNAEQVGVVAVRMRHHRSSALAIDRWGDLGLFELAMAEQVQGTFVRRCRKNGFSYPAI